MRVLSLAFLLLIAGLTPAAAQWKEYVYANQGFAIQFPSPPRAQRSVYMSARFGQLPATVYSALHDNVLYKITVIDFPRVEHGVNIVLESAYDVMRLGTVTFNDIPRIGNGPDGAYGICMVVDQADGQRLRSTSYFNGGRFYRADASVLPARGDKDMAVPSRFDQTLRFNVGAR